MGSVLALTVDLLEIADFATFDYEKEQIVIADISSPAVPTGTFKIHVTLTDGIETVFQEVNVLIYQAPNYGKSDDDSLEGDEGGAVTSGLSENGEPLEEDNELTDEEKIIEQVFDWVEAFRRKEELELLQNLQF